MTLNPVRFLSALIAVKIAALSAASPDSAVAANGWCLACDIGRKREHAGYGNNQSRSEFCRATRGI